MNLIHGTTVEIAGAGVLIRGPSGSGKSDLALRLIEGGAGLVADDQTELSALDGCLVARCPAPIAGLIEVRGIGLVRLAYRECAPISLVVDLVPAAEVERLPEPLTAIFLGIEVPRLRLAAFEISATAKVRLAMTSATRDIMQP
jgi:serine kinase of HPr protein (carbohydrate metabolism regulator)